VFIESISLENGHGGLSGTKTDLKGDDFLENSSGWFELERVPASDRVASGRWLSPHATTVWWNVPTPERKRLRMKVLHLGGRPLTYSQSIGLLVNGRPVASRAIAELSREELEYSIPAEALKAGLNSFSFSCGGYRQPAAGDKDPRNLCVFVERISLE
jgi:hypothetical protein